MRAYCDPAHSSPRDAAGNVREAIFFQDGDHEVDRDLLAEQTQKAQVEGVGIVFYAQ